MRLAEARVFFAARTHMLPTVQYNYKNVPEYRDNNHLCECQEPDTQAHLVNCMAYKHLQQGLKVKESDTDLVRFYQLVIKERREKEDRA